MLTKHSGSDSTCSDNVTDCPVEGLSGGRRNYAALTRREVPRTFIARFHTKYQIADGCWLWRAGKFAKGYGMVNLGRDACGTQHTDYAHRVAYVIAKGDIPEGMVVRHSCDTPACVNPDHLKLGTQGDNVQDASVQGKYLRGLTVGSHRWMRQQRRLGLIPDKRFRKAA